MSDTLERPPERTTPTITRREPVRIELPPRRRLTRWLAWMAALMVLAVGVGFGIAFLTEDGPVTYTPEFQQMLDEIASSYEGDLVNTLTPAPSIPAWAGETDVFPTGWPAGYTLDWVAYTYITDLDPTMSLEQAAAYDALLEELRVIADSYAGDISD